MILPYIFLVFTSMAFADVQHVCGLASPGVTKVKNLDDLDASICHLPGIAEDKALETLTAQTHTIIRSLRTDPKYTNDISADPLDDEKLLKNLGDITDLINAKHPTKNFTPVKNDALSQAMSSLFSNFGTEQARKKNPEGYYEAMKSVLAKTSQGAAVLECFERAEPNVKDHRVEFFKDGDSGTSAAATYQAVYNESTKDYSKVITLGPAFDPSQALVLLGHELKHSCDTQTLVKDLNGHRELEEKKEKLLGHAPEAQIDASMDAIEAFEAQINLHSAIDELRAYGTMPGLFSELASYEPSYFCEQVGAGKFFGRQISSIGQFYSTLETQLKQGSFINTLVDSYSIDGGYNPADFYQTNPKTGQYILDEKGEKKLRPEVSAAIAAAKDTNGP